MSDIVNDLRILYRQEKDEAHKRAADEIERLREEDAMHERDIATLRARIEEFEAEAQEDSEDALEITQ